VVKKEKLQTCKGQKEKVQNKIKSRDNIKTNESEKVVGLWVGWTDERFKS